MPRPPNDDRFPWTPARHLPVVATAVAGWLAVALAGRAEVVVDWTFNQSSGSVAVDAGPNGIDGTLTGSATWGVGLNQNAVSVTGDGFVNFTQPGSPRVPTVISSLAVGSIGVTFFVDAFPTDPSAHPILPIFWMGRNFGGLGQYGLTIEIGHAPPYTATYDRHLYFTIMNGAAPIQCFNTTEEILAGRWYSFVGVVAADGNTGYLNGHEMIDRHYNFGNSNSTEFFDSVTFPSNALWAGKGFLGDEVGAMSFNGLIQNLAIFDQPLSAAEVASLYSVPELDPGSAFAVGAFLLGIVVLGERRTSSAAVRTEPLR